MRKAAGRRYPAWIAPAAACLLLIAPQLALDACGGCPAGTETCACFGNGTCHDGLVCRSDLCVEDEPGAAGRDDDSSFPSTDEIMFGGDADTTVSVSDDQGSAGAAATSALQTCSVATATGEQPLIDDFEDGNLEILEHDGRQGSWYAYNSEETDENHVLEVVPLDAAAALDQLKSSVLRSAGGGFDWAGFGLGLRWGTIDDDGQWVECVYDASIYAGVSFRARGNDVRVRLGISVPEVIPIADGGDCEDSCYDAHGIELLFESEWQDYVLAFSELTQADGSGAALDTSQLRTLDFAVVDASQTFEIYIDDLSFVSDEELGEATSSAGAASAGASSKGEGGNAGAGGASG